MHEYVGLVLYLYRYGLITGQFSGARVNEAPSSRLAKTGAGQPVGQLVGLGGRGGCHYYVCIRWNPRQIK